MDRTLNQCIELLSEIKVASCDIHEGPNICKTCVKGNYQKNGACFAITAPIANCAIENERGICL